MDLEELCTSLRIPQHIPALSEWRDDLLREKAAEIQALHTDYTARLATAADYASRVSAAKNAILAAVADPEVDTAAAIAAIIAEGEKPEVDRRKEVLAAEIAIKQAELDTLNADGTATATPPAEN